MLYGYTSIFALYLYGHPFCLDAFNVGMLSLSQALTIIPISLMIMLCKNKLDKTYILPLLGSFSFIIGLIIFSISKKLWLLYIGKVILIIIFQILFLL